MATNEIISIFFKGIEIGKIGFDLDRSFSSFQYNPSFLDSGKYDKLFPYLIRRTKQVQVFSSYAGETFRSLPPMIADSLPDYFGNIIFKEWLESAHRDFSKISVLEQLTYVANRGMGALEYQPVKELPSNQLFSINEITEVLKAVLHLKTSTNQDKMNDVALLNIFRIGTSAGGARPKILVSEHKLTGEIMPGDIEYSTDYSHYLVKLNLEDTDLFNREIIEFIYYELAVSVGITMMPSKLIENKHFATLRFDRVNGEKKHVLTVSGLTGWDFKKAEDSSYENIFKLAIDLDVDQKEIYQLFKRLVFNIVFANTDDHLKNFSFIYNDLKNTWNLAPAYDLTYPLNPLINYTRISRSLSINGKRQNISRKDLLQVAKDFSIKNPNSIIDEITNSIPSFKEKALLFGIPTTIIYRIESDFSRL
jgi:serine/threonine-protein kinase HipA